MRRGGNASRSATALVRREQWHRRVPSRVVSPLLRARDGALRARLGLTSNLDPRGPTAHDARREPHGAVQGRSCAAAAAGRGPGPAPDDVRRVSDAGSARRGPRTASRPPASRQASAAGTASARRSRRSPPRGALPRRGRAERERQHAGDERERRHQDRPQAIAVGCRIAAPRAEALRAQLDRVVDLEDRVLLHDAEEDEDAERGVQVQRAVGVATSDAARTAPRAAARAGS
jgi:hypothetical protein